ncbi:MAG: deoxyribonuclease IV [Nitrospirota bacterium]|nr:MAG: deoxyribonuclease IV [Nitrospirota bacterium]
MKKPRVKKGPDVRIGFHTSIAGGVSKALERADELGCRTMQIFTHSPRQWARTAISEEEIKRFRDLRSELDITPVFSHTSYLINLASRSDDLLSRSIDFLSYEMDNAEKLGIEYVVLHTGSASGDDEKKARKRAARAISKALGKRKYRARLLLENTAGQKGDITSSVAALAEIAEQCTSDGIGGICIDTCHAFAAGYDLRKKGGVEQLLEEVNAHFGDEGLRLVHLNDCKRPYGSGVDRHEHIGKGTIGSRGFRNLLSDQRIRKVPLVMETPKATDEDDRMNLKKVKGILASIR